MHYFLAVVDRDEQSAIGGWFPDVPGCFFAADRDAELIPNAQEALHLHFGEDPQATPSHLNHLKTLPEVVQALENGAILLAVPV